MENNKSKRVDELYNMIAAADGDVDQIAQPFMDDLNAAYAKWQDQKDNQKKSEEAESVAESFNSFVEKWYPENKGIVKGKDIIEILDFMKKIFDPDMDVEDILANFCGLVRTDPQEKTFEEMIAEKGW